MQRNWYKGSKEYKWWVGFKKEGENYVIGKKIILMGESSSFPPWREDKVVMVLVVHAFKDLIEGGGTSFIYYGPGFAVTFNTRYRREW